MKFIEPDMVELVGGPYDGDITDWVPSKGYVLCGSCYSWEFMRVADDTYTIRTAKYTGEERVEDRL
jgi:hypothetical protein